ncbi:chromatin assembly factor 1 subunit A [Geosmithia morbida]|uniref:Chromatin assembly factor 1 subunit A n=1 Tax=Geosmithia morbida TaxID=1094350 RepID=A0A9P4YR81_9HYPO|nr:chromatin assembly factor 1 subunit A [Geosmithia morbida]KAF4120595.1 chromatin assembly factor 1 subunit A [Geosmithia morbida]
MSSNIRESDSAGRKRCHEEYALDAKSGGGAMLPSNASLEAREYTTHDRDEMMMSSELTPNSALAPSTAHLDPTPQASPSPTKGTPAHEASSPHTPMEPQPGEQETAADVVAERTLSETATATAAATAQRPRKKRLTPAEAAEKKKAKEDERQARAKDREEREKEAAEKKKEKEEERQAREKEREEKRKKKEEEDRAKAQDREKKKRKKEEEQRAMEEARVRKERLQPKLNNFFFKPQQSPKKSSVVTIQTASPKKDNGTSTADSTAPCGGVIYRRMFQPFFVKDHTTWVPPATDADGIRSSSLDEYIGGERTHDESAPFDPIDLLSLSRGLPPRGKLHHPVKNIMEEAYKHLQSNSGTTEPAGKAMQVARKKLARIPVKVICFSEDVRPPYYGTVTLKPFALGKAHMRRLARRPTGRSMPVEYDYDSEAEWQEEEGEDLDVDDDEEEIDDEDDMDGFLDDSEDLGHAGRAMMNAMEPDCTGICFEDENRKGPNEIVDGAATPTKMVKAEILDDVKRAIVDNRTLSKIGIIDFIFQKFRDNASRTEVKNTIEQIAEKKGTGRLKEWSLKSGHEIST